MLKFNFSEFDIECGTDEAGRGCLAGPVTAAAVCFPNSLTTEATNMLLHNINDSKQLSEKSRNLFKHLIEKFAISYSFIHIYNEEIDAINILNASVKAMQQSILKLSPTPSYIIVDGNSCIDEINNKTVKRFSNKKHNSFNNIPYTCIIKGDSKYLSIAAASILAKTYRDEYMNKIHEEFPMYNWKKNKGYPTKEHREAIAKYGISKYHRKSFRLLPEQLEFDF